MTRIIIAYNDGSMMIRTNEKSPEEICRDIELGVYPFPIPMTSPTAVRLRDYLLVTEQETRPLLSYNQRHILDLLTMGASETEIGRAMGLSFSGVRHHMTSLKKKFSVSTREELIAKYVQMVRN